MAFANFILGEEFPQSNSKRLMDLQKLCCLFSSTSLVMSIYLLQLLLGLDIQNSLTSDGISQGQLFKAFKEELEPHTTKYIITGPTLLNPNAGKQEMSHHNSICYVPRI